MSFLNPWMLFGLGAIAAPIVIHLWQRRNVTTMPFSTLRFLKIVALKTSRNARLENFILLFVRCLLFALLILAAALPSVSTELAKFLGGSTPRTVILAIDNSMSMGCLVNGTPRLEASKKQALDVLDQLNPSDTVAVIAAEGPPKLLIPQPTIDHKVARQIIEAIRPGETLSDFPDVFSMTRRVVAKSPDHTKELYLFTDSQETAWQFDPATVFDDAWKKLAIQTIVVAPDDLTPPNAAVVSLKISTQMVSPGSEVAGVAVVKNFSTTLLQDVLEIAVGGERIARKSLELPPGAAQEISFEGVMPQITSRWAEGTAKIQPDNLTPDDTFYFAIPVSQQSHVLIVEGQQPQEERLHSGFYLKKALEAGEAGGARATSIAMIAPADLDDSSLDQYSAIFFADVPSLSDRALVKIKNYIQSGGTVAFFPGDLTGVDVLKRFDFLPSIPVGVVDLPPGRLATEISDPTHPLIASTWDRSTPFPALPQTKMMTWKPGSGARSLLTFSNGTPFLIAGNLGAGQVFLVNASADRAWGDFPLSPAFLPLIQQIARLSTDRVFDNTSRLVGESLPMTARLPSDQILTIKMPDAKNVTVPAGEKSDLLDRTEKSGLYLVSSPKDGIIEIFSVNADRKESDLKPISKEALGKILPGEVVVGEEGIRRWLTQSRGNTPLWPVLLLAALVIFGCEEVLSNLLARNRSQGNEKHIMTGRLNKRRFGVAFRPMVTEVES